MADINIYGKFVNQLEDGRLADTTQIYDPNLQKFQSEINESLATIDYPSAIGVLSEIASGKQVIAQAINAKGGTASATESFTELAEAVEDIPNFDDMVKLAGIIAGGNYDKNTLEGHNENVKYGKTEIVDNVGAFEKINIPYCFQYWDLLRTVTMNSLTTIRGGGTFRGCTSLQNVTLSSLTTITNGGNEFNGCTALQNVTLPSLTTVINAGNLFRGCTSLQNVTLPNLTTINGGGTFQDCTALQNVIFGIMTHLNDPFTNAKPNLRNITIGQDTNTNLPFHNWTATNVIAEDGGIDELNSNLQTNLISKLYQGGGKILRLGTSLYDVTTQETRDMVTAKGWTLQRG